MKRIEKIIFIFTLSVLLLLALNGCGSEKRRTESKIYEENINSFFTALDNKDPAAIKSMFSHTVIQKDDDLDEQIAKLIAIYPYSETEIMFDGLIGGSYENESGKFKSTAFATIPVICGGEYYWIYFELIYEDDFCEENVGVNSIYFYTADEYCALFHDDSRKHPDDLGLLVFSDLKLENEVRPIESHPYEFTPIERTINVADVEKFLASNKSWSEFTDTFGQPNANGWLESYYYEITENDGTANYLEINITRGEIVYANILGEFEYIRSIFKEVNE